MPVETRYFRSDTWTINGLLAYKLLTAKSGVGAGIAGLTFTDTCNGFDAGIRVWKRSSAGAETEITAGAPVAVVSCPAGGYNCPTSNTWNCPLTALACPPNYSMVVRLYMKSDPEFVGWTLVAAWTTEQLGLRINNTLWTVTYCLYSYCYTGGWQAYFYFDGTYPSRIDNFSYDPCSNAQARNKLLLSSGL